MRWTGDAVVVSGDQEIPATSPAKTRCGTWKRLGRSEGLGGFGRRLERESDFALLRVVHSVTRSMLGSTKGCIDTIVRELALIWAIPE
jgi:hypothetical protein